jgi:hypothetical protein
VDGRWRRPDSTEASGGGTPIVSKPREGRLPRDIDPLTGSGGFVCRIEDTEYPEFVVDRGENVAVEIRTDVEVVKSPLAPVRLNGRRVERERTRQGVRPVVGVGTETEGLAVGTDDSRSVP